MSQSEALYPFRLHADLTEQSAMDAVVGVVAANPTRTWRTSDLARELAQFAVLDVVIAVTLLHRSGGLERTGIATYRHPTTNAVETSEHNERAMWGPTAP